MRDRQPADAEEDDDYGGTEKQFGELNAKINDVMRHDARPHVRETQIGRGCSAGRESKSTWSFGATADARVTDVWVDDV